MKSLLYKEFVSVKVEIFTYFCLQLVFFLFSLTSNIFGIFAIVPFVFSIILLVKGLNIDEKSKLLKNVFLTRIERKQWIMSKYIVFGIYIFLNWILMVICSFTYGDLRFMVVTLTIVFTTFIIGAMVIPVCIKFGVKYALAPFVIVYMACIGTFILFPRNIVENSKILLALYRDETLIYLMFFVVACIIGVLGYFISVKLIEKKDI